MARTRVVVRRNGRVVGQVVYGSEAEAVRHAATMQREASGLEALLAPAAPATNRKPRRRKNGTVYWTPHGPAPEASGPTRWASVEVESRDGKTYSVVAYGYADGKEVRSVRGFGYKTPEKAYEAADAIRRELRVRRNPSIGRGTKHRDIVAKAVAKRLRGQGVPKREAVSRGFAIATAAELRHNPTPIDIASLEFKDFAKTVIIDSQYNVRSGRRFARVISKDGTFVTDVPVADGQGSGAKGAKAIKRRAWEQLRIHLQPSNWKPSVRVNPAGNVAYGGTSIRIHNGTYQVQPHGPSFQGPDGFVRAKAWIDQHGA